MAERLLTQHPRDQNALVRMANPEKISPVSGDKDVAAIGTAERLLPLPVTGIVQGTKTITISGDWTDYIGEGDTIDMEDSTGNDGAYTVVSATENAGSTDIVTSQALPDATVDGDVVIDIPVRKIRITGKAANTGEIYLGGSNVSSSNGEVITSRELTVVNGDAFSRLDLNEHFIDTEVNGEGVTILYYRV